MINQSNKSNKTNNERTCVSMDNKVIWEVLVNIPFELEPAVLVLEG